MRPFAKAAVGVSVLVVAGLVAPGAAGPAHPGPTLGAVPFGPLLDTDQDGIPDLLEFVGHSDPTKPDTDGDGRSDFVEFLDFTSPNVKDRPKRPRVDGFRLMISSTEEGPSNQQVLWIHLLFRFRSGDRRDLKGLGLWIDIGGNRYALDPLLGMAVAEVVELRRPVQGLLTRVTFKVPLFAQFGQFAPMTFGAYAWVNNLIHPSGAMLFQKDGVYYTIMPVGSAIVFQTTSATARNPFWSTHKRCVLTLEVQGVGRSGQILEVKKAGCETSNTRRCTSACPGMRGQTFFVPDGLPLILGG